MTASGRHLEAEVFNGDIVHDAFTREPIRCLQCHADLTKQGHEWACSHHPTAPVCEECGENLRANGHKGTCSQSVMLGGSPMPNGSGSFTIASGFYDTERFVTITTVTRAKWWKRPWLWLLGRPTRWTSTYPDMCFTGFTLTDGGGMRADFTTARKEQA